MKKILQGMKKIMDNVKELPLIIQLITLGLMFSLSSAGLVKFILAWEGYSLFEVLIAGPVFIFAVCFTGFHLLNVILTNVLKKKKK